MQAIVYERYGGPEVLELQEVERPSVADGEVLVRVQATSVNPADWHMMRATPALVRLSQGLLKPKRPVLGFDLSGTVEAVGGGVERFHVGDEVFGFRFGGAFAEWAAVPESRLTLKPAGVSHEHAGATPVAALTALQALRDSGQIEAGEQVLVNGAAGGVGTFAVQIAKSFGATVTGVCSTRNLELVGTLGADHVVDYTREDFTRLGKRYDLILDAVGNRSLSDNKRALKADGLFVAAAGSPRRGLWMKLTGGKRMVGMRAKPTVTDLETLAELLGSGEITPVIDRSYPLAEVPEAIRYLEEGHARGKVVITV